MRLVEITAVVLLASSLAVSTSCALELKYEAEDVVVNTDAWQKDKFTETHWNLWSTDKDADKKWSEGVVLQSPRVMADRQRPEDGAPPLHVRIRGIPKGRFEITIPKVGRVLAISRDGKQWQRFRGGVWIPEIEIDDGELEFWLDDRFALADEQRRGSGYFDYVLVSSLEPLNLPPRPPVQGWAQRRVEEPMGRGLVAVRTEVGAYLSWRLLRSDPADIRFDVFRQDGAKPAKRLNDRPVRQTTDYLDLSAPVDEETVYLVRPLSGGGPVGRARPAAFSSRGAGCLTIELHDADTRFQKVGVADLDGDGAYDYVIKQPNANIDPYKAYWKPSPDTYKLEAYLSDGQFLWSHDLGWAIERGIWYSPYIVWDLTGDGKAEVAAKIGEGDPRDPDGRVTTGPEYVVVWDGLSGREIDRAPWPARELIGDYNHASRNQLAVAYLDGKTPCLILLRGTYGRMLADAYELRDGKLVQLWRYDNKDYGRRYRGQGAHFTLAGDVDEDGREEVILGSAVIDDNGLPLWTTGKGHPDGAYLTDVDPQRPGLEMAYIMETRQAHGGICTADAKTGKLLWELQEPTRHVHSKGLCADIDPTVPGQEIFGMDSVSHQKTEKRWLFSADGKVLRSGTELTFGFSVPTAFWDADLQKELVSGAVSDYQGAVLARLSGSVQLIADVIGDWREELIATSPGELRIYTTTIPAFDRRVCLMQDPVYRGGVVMNAMGYTQPPTLTRCLEATAPNINITALSDSPGTCRLVVSAPMHAGVNGQVLLHAGAGLRAEPAAFAVRLRPGDRIAKTVKVTRESESVASGSLTAALQTPGRSLRVETPVRLGAGFITSGIHISAESFVEELGGKVHIRDDKAGVEGKALSHWDDVGHTLTWTFRVAKPGARFLALRYSSPFDVQRRVRLDGADMGVLALPATGGFGDLAADWEHGVFTRDGQPAALPLAAGAHRLSLENIDGKGCNLDYLAFTEQASP